MRQLTIERAAVIILFGLLFALATRVPFDTDTWWHIRSGEYTLTQGMIYNDPFSFTMAGAPWINHSWGAQIILYAVWQLGGNFGLAIYVSVLATAGMWFVYRMCSGSVYLRAFALVIGASTAAVFWSARPQMISFFLSTILLYMLYQYKYRQGQTAETSWTIHLGGWSFNPIWLVPVIMGIWGNLHAGFSIGFIFIAGFIAGETLGRLFNPKGEHILSWTAIRNLIIIGLLSAVAICVNPYGLQMLAVPFQTISIGALQNFIQEWNSPNFHDRGTWPFLFLLFGLLGAVGASKRKLDWTDFLLSAGTAALGLFAGRNIAVFAVVATPVLTRHLDDVLTERGWVIRPVQRVTPRMARLNAILVGVIMLGCLLKVLLVLDGKTVSDAQKLFLPVEATEYVQANHPQGPMFNSYNWGGYLMFKLPDYPVFADGRTDLYGDKFLTGEYVRAATGSPGWQEILNQYGVNMVFMEKDSGLSQVLRDEPDWKIVHEDGMAVIFVRQV